MQGVAAYAPHHSTIVARILAIGRAAVERVPTDAADVVSGVPRPGRDCVPLFYLYSEPHTWDSATRNLHVLSFERCLSTSSFRARRVSRNSGGARAPHFSIAKSVFQCSSVLRRLKRQLVDHLGQSKGFMSTQSIILSQLYDTEYMNQTALRSISTKLIEPKLLVGSKFVSDCIIAICRDLAYLACCDKSGFC